MLVIVESAFYTAEQRLLVKISELYLVAQLMKHTLPTNAIQCGSQAVSVPYMQCVLLTSIELGSVLHKWQSASPTL